MNIICRYKSFSFKLKIACILYVLVLYFNKALLFLKMCTSIEMYLFHTTYVLGFRKKLFLVPVSIDNYLYLQLAPSSAGISFMIQLFAIELAYSHSVLLRLFNGFIKIKNFRASLIKQVQFLKITFLPKWQNMHFLTRKRLEKLGNFSFLLGP